MSDITSMLKGHAIGSDRDTLGRIVSELYPELRRLAHSRLARNNALTLLDTSAMVHETYERLARGAQLEARSRGQFMAYAAQVMRSILVDFARKRSAERRGGGAIHLTLSTGLLDTHGGIDADIEQINEALLELEASDPRLRQIVEMRFFGGFDESEIAESLGVNERTVRRGWERARLMLRVAIRK
ncbi:MAG: sigma-70 family RNA polymerase sigma factor [Pseudomonadota bacterium]|nr:sigma-70 family RNA polymerase sigma factor [Pseudomonadota bacterium]